MTKVLVPGVNQPTSKHKSTDSPSARVMTAAMQECCDNQASLQSSDSQSSSDSPSSSDNPSLGAQLLARGVVLPTYTPMSIDERVQTWHEGQRKAGGAEAPPRQPSQSRNTSPRPSYAALYRSQQMINRYQERIRRTTFKPNEEWRQWVEVKVRLTPLPARMTTWQMYDIFSIYGNLVKIDIDMNVNRSVAHISFCPPPKIPFWEQRVVELRTPGGRRFVMTPEMLPPPRRFYHVSPVDKSVRYPEKMRLDAMSLAFGMMYDASTMMIMKEIVHMDTPIEMTLNLLDFRQQIEIQFSLPAAGEKSDWDEFDKFRFHLPLHKISTIHEVITRAGRAFIIPFEMPPEFYKQTRNIEATHDDRASTWTDWRTWFRETDIPADRPDLLTMAVGFKNPGADIDIGRWTTYRLEFSGSDQTNKAMYDLVRKALTDYNIQIISYEDSSIKTCGPSETVIWRILDVEPKKEHANSLDALSEMAATVHLSFPVRYQFEVCMSRGYLNEINITEDFLRKLAALPEPRALSLLERVTDRKERVYEPMSLFDANAPRRIPISHTPKSCIAVRSATVTPSTIYFSTPQVEVSNRVLRRFSDFHDHFLRVKFADEGDRGRIGSRDDDTMKNVFERVRRTLNNGIILGNRKYEFLAFGSSQFREHGAYFCAPFNDGTRDWTAAQIRDWLGDMSDIRTVSKLCSRIGLSFSTTRAIDLHTTPEVQTTTDIIRNGFKFTDGVGMISESLARIIGTEFGVPNCLNDPPSLFQFRMGGCKGVLVIDPRLKGTTLCIRRSQYKFPARLNGLEAIRVSQFAAATTNRQLITILSSLGVSEDVFLTKLRQHLTQLDEAMVNENVAIESLSKNIDINQSTLLLAGIINNGFMTAKDPFLMTMLHLWRIWNIKYIKEKAKVFIQKGAFLFGCVDELGVLQGHFEANEPNKFATREVKEKRLPEIFLRVDPEKKGEYTVITGVCILARNPSLHPGDIRIVRAVDKPELYHLKNVVVMPQTGDQDLPSMCSGGDLDGDDYIVIWDPDLMPAVAEWNYPPMDFTPKKANPINRKISTGEIIDFFVTYMKNDKLPTIAHAHLAWADYSPEGVKDEKCLELAQLHSQAVDYPKSGIPAKIPRYLYPRMWPHFMEKNRPANQVYQSKTILGKIYDHVQVSKFVPRYELAFDERVLNAYDLSPEALQKAASVKEEYDNAMRRIMAQHAVGTEFEIFSAFVLAHNFEKKDYNFAEELGHQVVMLKERFRKCCIEEAGGKEFDNLGPFVAAMYAVTARQVNEALQECKMTRQLRNGATVPLRKMEPKEMPLMSFPWIFDHELGKIANGGFEQERVKRAQAERRRGRQTGGAGAAAAAANTVVETAAGPVHHGEDLILFDSPPRVRNAEDRSEKAQSEADVQTEDKNGKTSTSVAEKLPIKNEDDAEYAAMIEAGIHGRPTSGPSTSNKRQLFDPKAAKAPDWAPGVTIAVHSSQEDAHHDKHEFNELYDVTSDSGDEFVELDIDEALNTPCGVHSPFTDAQLKEHLAQSAIPNDPYAQSHTSDGAKSAPAVSDAAAELEDPFARLAVEDEQTASAGAARPFADIEVAGLQQDMMQDAAPGVDDDYGVGDAEAAIDRLEALLGKWAV